MGDRDLSGCFGLFPRHKQGSSANQLSIYFSLPLPFKSIFSHPAGVEQTKSGGRWRPAIKTVKFLWATMRRILLGRCTLLPDAAGFNLTFTAASKHTALALFTLPTPITDRTGHRRNGLRLQIRPTRKSTPTLSSPRTSLFTTSHARRNLPTTSSIEPGFRLLLGNLALNFLRSVWLNWRRHVEDWRRWRGGCCRADKFEVARQTSGKVWGSRPIGIKGVKLVIKLGLRDPEVGLPLKRGWTLTLARNLGERRAAAARVPICQRQYTPAGRKPADV
jgi:hypothetical protein